MRARTKELRACDSKMGVSDHEFFGSRKGRETVKQVMDRLRRPRSLALTMKAQTKQKSREASRHSKGDDLSPEFLRELRRRIADAKDPVKYAVFSEITDRPCWRLWLDVSDDVYGMSIDQATMFKRKHVAMAVAKACSSGRKNSLSVAKLTTKNGKRGVIRVEK